MKKLSILGLLMFLIFAAIAVYWYYSKELYQNAPGSSAQASTQASSTTRTIVFLTDKETSDFLVKDNDAYVKNMSKPDLFARQAKTPEEYIKMISKCTLSFTPDEREKLIRCTRMADEFFQKSNHIIEGSLIAPIAWKFALICDSYEEGLPHTREDIIFLSKSVLRDTDNQFTSTLIHEKVHIFQRGNKEYMDNLLQKLGYQVVGSRADPRFALKRSNPDINDIVYRSPDTGKEMIFIYRNDKPEFIDDVFKDQAVEHPYEKIAYDIANKYLQEYLKGMVKSL